MAEIGRWRPPPRVTLEDVAERAKVSRASVSVVLRDAPGASAETRRRVRQAVDELGYRPDVRARSLASPQSKLIGVLFDVVAPFHFDLLDGMYAAAEQQGYGLMLSALTRGRDERRALESVQEFRLDALVMLGPATSAPLLAGQLPIVTLGWRSESPGVDSVRTSDGEGMAKVVGHLAGLGHERIAYIDGGPHLISEARRAAYVDAMREQGLDRQVELVSGGPSQVDGQKAMSELLERDRRPTAVIVYNDEAATGALAVLAQHRVRVPRDMSVVGWDDSYSSHPSPTALTSVAQQPQQLAQLAISRIVDRINSTALDGYEVVFEPTLIVRSTTGRRRP